MLSQLDPPIITTKDVTEIDFYHDFIAYLTYLKNTPIKRTTIGNISLSNIKPLLVSFRTIEKKTEEFKKYGITIHTEDRLPELSQIKLLADVMHLTYKRHNKILLSRSGLAFLENLSPLEQYTQVVLHYWYRLNWDYFSNSTQIKNVSLAELLQQVQHHFWKFFLQKEDQWIDYLQFCNVTSDYFYLQPFLGQSFIDSPYDVYHDITQTLFTRNLLLFNCIETVNKPLKKYFFLEPDIVKFRPTHIGLYLFHKALFENSLT